MKIKLTDSDIKRIVNESVSMILKEDEDEELEDQLYCELEDLYHMVTEYVDDETTDGSEIFSEIKRIYSQYGPDMIPSELRQLFVRCIKFSRSGRGDEYSLVEELCGILSEIFE